MVDARSQEALPLTELEFSNPLNYSIITGAVPGYVDDKTCASCHEALYKSYQHVGGKCQQICRITVV